MSRDESGKGLFRHILVPTEGSSLGARAVAKALEIAGATGARITAINVVPVPPMAGYVEGAARHPDLLSPEEAQAAVERGSKAILDEVCAQAKTAGVACERVTELEAAPWKAIVRAARRRECDLIIMATHGRRGLESLLLRSETRKVLSHSEVPVLVCH